MNPDIYLTALYAEDIRQEVESRTSVIGIYGRSIPVSGNGPFVLGKLAVLATLRVPRTAAFDDITARVKLDETVLIELPPMRKKLISEIVQQIKDEQFFDITVNIQQTTLTVPALGVLRAEFRMGDQTYTDQIGRRLVRGTVPTVTPVG